MKLYEFTFNDNTNMTESVILEVLQSQLADEALLQGWASGYNLQQCQKPKQLDNGEIEYFFVVEGEFNTEISSKETKRR